MYVQSSCIYIKIGQGKTHSRIYNFLPIPSFTPYAHRIFEVGQNTVQLDNMLFSCQMSYHTSLENYLHKSILGKCRFLYKQLYLCLRGPRFFYFISLSGFFLKTKQSNVFSIVAELCNLAIKKDS